MSIIRNIKPKSGWELIPNRFAEDLALSEDAVAVGLWLACKPSNWEVRPAFIQSEFSKRPGKPRGREWWSRVSGELKSSGYLRLYRMKDSDGKFSSLWDFCVQGLEDDFAMGGSADTGSADTGLPNSGPATGGSHYQSKQHSNNQYSDNQDSTTTTTTNIAPQARSSSKNENFDNLKIEPVLTKLLPELLKVIEKEHIDEIETAQDFLDELAGSIEAAQRGEREKIGSPPGWLRRVIARYRRGEFDRNYCETIQARRARKSQETKKTEVEIKQPRNPDVSKKAVANVLAILKNEGTQK